MIDKIKVLIIPSDSFGVGHYRSIWPAQAIQKYYGEEFEVDIRLNLPITEKDIGKFDIVHFHRRINKPEETIFWINKFKDSGCCVIADLDDYWIPFCGHPARDIVLKNNVHLQILKSIKESNYITTTTDIFKKHIVKTVGHDNVMVIPNAIDKDLPMWKSENVESDGRVRVAWIGGSSHERDLNRIKGSFNRLFNDKEVRDKIQVVMCGYDTRGTVTEINPMTKEQRTRPISPDESIWNKFESIFNDYGNANNNQYVRRYTLPITQYGKHYNYCDICLAPLDQHTFNECKSELKIIETGMMGKALIASDLYIYKELLKNNETAILIDPKRDHKDWSKAIKNLVLDDDLRKSLAKNLNKLVCPCYSLKEVTKNRVNWYKSIL